jgi:hypothetical protein
MHILNFAHPLTLEHQSKIESLSKQSITKITNIKTHLDHQQPFVEQVRSLLAELPFTEDEWQTERFLVNLPSLNIIAATLLSELHGRMGYFPVILRLRPIADSIPLQFEVAELINLQTVRDQAREKR